MAAESIYEQRRPGFPKKSISEAGYSTLIEYVGIYEDLVSASPNLNATWGDYNGRVTTADVEPIETTDYGILTVVVEFKFGAGGTGDGGGTGGTGTIQEITTEIDWVDVQRSLYEHPKFATDGGGSFKLTSEDIAQIRNWQRMNYEPYKKEYRFAEDPDSWNFKTNGITGTKVLSANGKMFARGIELGIEYWVDKAPVIRWNATYIGGPPPTGATGQKENPTGVAGVPTGYEWVRSADRGIQQGGQTHWARSIEWIGAKKVWIDVDQIFWSAPT